MLTPGTIQIVKQTAPLLGQHAEELTRLFYQRMFKHNPEVKPFFNAAHQHSGRQQKALAGAIVAYASHIDRLEAIGSAVELIAHKHVSLTVKPEHYPIVGENLLAAIKELLGDRATPEIIDAWAEAYTHLAEIMIARENQLYQEQTQQHGWTGFRDFKVTGKTLESDEIVSLYLKPSDGGPVREHKPGQYLTLRLPSPGDPHADTTMRNYSISAGPNREHLRISVKREDAPTHGGPAGFVSNTLHKTINVGDHVEVGPPCGEFVLDTDPTIKRPLVLISGGVGITPLLSMLYAAINNKLDREIYFIHAARNGDVHAFRQEVTELAKQHPKVHVQYCYSEPTESDQRENRFHWRGYVDLACLKSALNEPDADYYFCGPTPFMELVSASLFEWGVPAGRIRYEHFGPQLELEPAIIAGTSSDA